LSFVLPLATRSAEEEGSLRGSGGPLRDGLWPFCLGV
jgi:hypothetical protein